MDEPLNYADLKALVDQLDRPLKTLVAQADTTDPFMAGLPWRKERAQWFAVLWRRFDFPPRTHVRRVHYVLISQEDTDPVSMPNGEAYVNTMECYKFLSTASRDARHLGLVQARDLDDRRNDEAVVNFDGEETEAVISVEGGLNEYVAPSFEIPELRVEAPKIAQRYCESTFGISTRRTGGGK
jgi:hypothetical protein